MTRRQRTDILAEIEKRESRSSRTTFYLPKSVRDALQIRVLTDGYGARGKGRWIEDTINWFLDPEISGLGRLPGSGDVAAKHAWKALVCYTGAIKGEKIVRDLIFINPATHHRLWKASLEAALYGIDLDPPIYLDASLSSVLRAAIVWRLNKPKMWAPRT
ncbi:hypothetical protein BJI67_16455 (plasmid) [Acidihalobacter aeolianus]|uniref:Uncharacterized protein n=1 Tax=Acidihalobacter aeolianus TaxID=2792603 RepID=A0A1D8KCZ7_9GAMM|nr:hypothetical protein [Acidihalobacter aeolianus]AOV18829.1 hypothetical protein BJI67_16455 [Acidihalobacter aeolianus]